MAGSGWEAAAVVWRLGGGGAVRRGSDKFCSPASFLGGASDSSTEWTVYEMACFLCFPLLWTETGTPQCFSWCRFLGTDRGCSMEACERISHIFYVLLALFAWNLDLFSLDEFRPFST